jgi:tetratricopeptide (TPR) repeat protein
MPVTPSAILTTLKSRIALPVFRVLLSLLLAGLMIGSAAAQRPTDRQRRVTPKPPDEVSQPASPKDELDRIREIPSQDERIDRLAKFLSANRGKPVEPDARQALMREYALRGEQRLREGSPQRAMDDFKAVFRTAPQEMSDPVFGQYIFPLPMAMNSFGYRTESAELMKSFEPRFQNDPNRLVQIGFFYVQIEAPLEAVRVLEHAIELAPQDHRAHNSLGTAYLINLRLEDAESEFARALELDQHDEYANLNLANMLRARGDHEHAVTYYRKQLQVKPDDADAHGGLAISLIALGRDEEAATEINRATELEPQNYRFFTQLAYFYAVRKKTAPARTLIERALTTEPRYAWGHIARANIDAQDGKLGNALSTMILAQQLGVFPTLSFELAKTLMMADGYDQAAEVMKKGFVLSDDGEFQATLGGVMKARSPRLDLLLERERQASLFLKEQTTTSLQYKLAEALFQIDHYSKIALAARPKGSTDVPRPNRSRVSPQSRTGSSTKQGSRTRRDEGAASGGVAADAQSGDSPKGAARPRRAGGKPAVESYELSAGADAGLPGMSQLMNAIKTFTTLDDGRQAFRMLWMAHRLAEDSLALDAAVQLARLAMLAADSATEPVGSMRDAPLLNREERKQVFLGRAEDALGWALFKAGDAPGAIDHLTRSVNSYPMNGERKDALWHLAIATEQAGDQSNALDFYIASYDAGSPSATVRRAKIEVLYQRLKGSLSGLDDRLKQ